MKVVVTGGTGLVGRALVPALLAKDDDVTLLIRPGGSHPLTEPLRNARVRKLDLLDTEAVSVAARDADVFYHLALSWRNGNTFGPEDAADNLDILQSVLAATSRAGVKRLVQASSVAVYGDPPMIDRPVSETSLSRGHRAYASYKRAAERSVEATCRRAAMQFALARPSFIYCPGVATVDRYLDFLASHPRLAWTTRTLNPVLETGDVTHWVHMDDAIRALCILGSHPRAANGRFNIVGNTALRRCGVMAVVRAFFLEGQKPDLPRAAYPIRDLYDGTRASIQLGFRPRVDIADGIVAVLSNNYDPRARS